MNIGKQVRLMFRALLLIVLLLCGCPSIHGAAQQIRRSLPKSKYRFVFTPIRLPGRHYPVTIEMRGKQVEEESIPGRLMIGDVTATFFRVRHGKRTVLSSANLSDLNLFFLDVSLYRHHKSGQYLLAVEDNGGQYDHTQVYFVNPRRLRLVPLFEHGVLQGDPKALSRGILVEHTYEHYVKEHPTGHRMAHRAWCYHPASHRFTPGRLFWDEP